MSQTPSSRPSGPSFAQQATTAAQTAAVKAGELTHTNRAKIDSAIGKAADLINRQTKGKYTGAVSKVVSAARKGVDQVEKQRHHTPPSAPGSTTPPTTPASPTGSATPSPAPHPTTPPTPPPPPKAGWHRGPDGQWVSENPPPTA